MPPDAYLYEILFGAVLRLKMLGHKYAYLLNYLDSVTFFSKVFRPIYLHKCCI